MNLDEETERIIGEFAAAKWQHGHRSADDESIWPELDRAGAALVARIQTLVREAVLAERKRILKGVEALP